MYQCFLDLVKKFGIWITLFLSLLVWTINGYEVREKEYVKHEQEYHRIIVDNTRVMQDSQTLMKESQQNLKENTELMKGYKILLEVKLDQIQKEVERIRGNK